ncbi:hypothetical protein AGMMS49921_06190 [Endomicrobiia bacterium]|nr:hypothetical protein AGMMS49921_06190 [Endomicrobiia bacterium]
MLFKNKRIFKANWDAVDAIAERLIKDKELDFDELEEIMEIVGKRKPK